MPITLIITTCGLEATHSTMGVYSTNFVDGTLDAGPIGVTTLK